MPNLTAAHEAPLELIRQHPALAVDLLRAFTGLYPIVIDPQHAPADRHILEDLMRTEPWKDEFTERYVDQGRAEGRAEGAVEAKISDIMKVLGVRDLHPTKKQLARMAACTDLATLNRWFDRSLTAANAAEVFAD